MLNEETKRGVKMIIIDSMDYPEYREICDAMLKIGYSATIVSNGVTVFKKGDD